MGEEKIVRIHLVDDSPVFRERMMLLLQELGGISITGHSESAEEAVRSIKAQMPDVVLLDIRLKSGTGFDVLRAVCAGSTGPIFIVVTSYTAPIYRKMCLRNGAYAFITKASGTKELATILGGLRMQQPREAGRT